jgi:GDP-D-mannose 3',5'-epimerase
MRFRETYGWEPSISLREGLEKTYAWVSEQVERAGAFETVPRRS